MDVIATPEAMVAWSDASHASGATIGLVPTMGYLHAGHRSLMARLRGEVDRLVVSIYVNPLQFGAGEDLDTYPRDLEGDLAKCRAEGVDAVFTPSEMYPPGFASGVSVSGLTMGLCGGSRPGHFDGVTTVCARLFGLTRCDLACFGEKDFQQLMVLRRMVRDLAMPLRIVPGPIVRDADNLALSSRNAYLSAQDRARGLSLHRALFAMRDAVAGGETSTEALLALGHGQLAVDRVDYLEIVDAESLKPVSEVTAPSRALVAGFVGKTRLIDNVGLGPELSWT
jgi:pantoate--beta-alanine ligase